VAWVGHDDHTGAVMELRGAGGVSLFVGRVGVSFVTTESLSERDDIETGQVKARHTGSVFEQRKGTSGSHPSCSTPSSRDACRRWPPISHRRRPRPRRCSARAAGSRLGIPRMRRRGPARNCCIAGVLGCNARRGDQPSTEEFGPPLTGVGPDEATTPTSRR